MGRKGILESSHIDFEDNAIFISKFSDLDPSLKSPFSKLGGVANRIFLKDYSNVLVKWFDDVGNRDKFFQWVFSYFPDPGCYQTYVEPFGGSMAFLFRLMDMCSSRTNDNGTKFKIIKTYNDFDGGLVNLYQVMQNKEKRRSIVQNFLKEFSFSREEMSSIRKIIEDRSWKDDVTWAKCFSVVLFQSFFDLKSQKSINDISEYIMQVQIDSLSPIDCVKNYNRDSTFFYFDLPDFSFVSKKEKSEFYHSFFDFILSVRGKFLLSGTVKRGSGKGLDRDIALDLFRSFVNAGWNYHRNDSQDLSFYVLYNYSLGSSNGSKFLNNKGTFEGLGFPF